MTNEATTSGGQMLEHATLEAPPIHIPDGKGGAYKTELVERRSPLATVKILWWHADDPREEPHNHPWNFSSEILSGGYTEDRYTFVDGLVLHGSAVYRAGDRNTVFRGTFHNVRDVLPGTVTRMTCGEAVTGNEWGYLDLETGEVLPWNHPSFASAFPFIEQLREINPHMREK